MLGENTTIPAMISHAAQRYRGQVAIEDGEVQLTYEQLDELRLQVARALMALGIQPGDRVAIWAPNCYEWVAAALGIHSAGAVLVPINTRMKGMEVGDVLEQSGAKLLFCIGEFLGSDYPAMLTGHTPETMQHLVVLRGQSTADQLDWAAFLEQSQDVPLESAQARAEQVKPESLSDLMFTSGTTGRPKGVMTAHGQNLRAFAYWSENVGLSEGDRYLIISPFFHSFGYKAGWIAALIRGATILPHQVFDAGEVLERISRDKINVLPGPPTLYLSMLAHPQLADYDLSSLRVAVTGAAAIAPSLVERMWSELGFKVVVTAYGLTESCGLATMCLPSDDATTIATTCGRAVPGVELRIVDGDNRELPAGQPGEVLIRGYNVMQGYFGDEASTQEAVDADGWLRTGDVGVLNEQGYLQITDRIKDMYIVGGFNCYPAEIEQVLLTHPAIAQVAVVGQPDERLGEVGKAFVVLRNKAALTAEELTAWARERMANYKVPREVEFLSELPTNASGKVLRYQLRQEPA